MAIILAEHPKIQERIIKETVEYATVNYKILNIVTAKSFFCEIKNT